MQFLVQYDPSFSQDAQCTCAAAGCARPLVIAITCTRSELARARGRPLVGAAVSRPPYLTTTLDKKNGHLDYCKSRIFRMHFIFVYFVRGGFGTKI